MLPCKASLLMVLSRQWWAFPTAVTRKWQLRSFCGKQQQNYDSSGCIVGKNLVICPQSSFHLAFFSYPVDLYKTCSPWQRNETDRQSSLPVLEINGKELLMLPNESGLLMYRDRLIGYKLRVSTTIDSDTRKNDSAKQHNSDKQFVISKNLNNRRFCSNVQSVSSPL